MWSSLNPFFRLNPQNCDQLAAEKLGNWVCGATDISWLSNMYIQIVECRHGDCNKCHVQLRHMQLIRFCSCYGKNLMFSAQISK